MVQLVEIVESHAAGLDDQRGGPLLRDHDALKGPAAARFSAALERTDECLIAGEFDGQVFGVAHVVLQSLPGSVIARLEQFVVDADARAVGVGETMMNLAIEWARSHDCAGIDSQALPGDRQTKNFFEGFGLKARLLTVHYRFPETQPES